MPDHTRLVAYALTSGVNASSMNRLVVFLRPLIGHRLVYRAPGVTIVNLAGMGPMGD